MIIGIEDGDPLTTPFGKHQTVGAAGLFLLLSPDITDVFYKSV